MAIANRIMFKKISKQLLAFSLLVGGLLFARFVFAQDFGTNIVNDSLNNINYQIMS